MLVTIVGDIHRRLKARAKIALRAAAGQIDALGTQTLGISLDNATPPAKWVTTRGTE